MKKILLTIITLLCSMSFFAQTEFDAAKISETDILGSARYMGMAGAFGALGGDPSSININPAGLGVYRNSEISISGGALINSSNTSWNNITDQDNLVRGALNNVGLVFSLNTHKSTGLVSANFSVTFNKIKNFHQRTFARGNAQSASITNYLAEFSEGIPFNDLAPKESPFNSSEIGYLSVLAHNTCLISPDTVSGGRGDGYYNSSLNEGELVTPRYESREEGYLNEWNIAYAMNYSNKIYFGLSLGLQDLLYRKDTYYSETFNDGGYMDLYNHREIRGFGVNINIGTIYRPIDEIRLGLAIHTPTFFISSRDAIGIEDIYEGGMTSQFNGENSCTSPRAENYYQLYSPWKLNASTAFVIGQKCLLSLDYELKDYSHMKFSENSGSSYTFKLENNNINNNLRIAHSLRVGFEINAIAGLFVRAGYAFVTSPYESNAYANLPINTTYTDPSFTKDRWTNYFSAGFGYRQNRWFVDIAYLLKQQKQDFYTYQIDNTQAIPAEFSYLIHNINITGGFKF